MMCNMKVGTMTSKQKSGPYIYTVVHRNIVLILNADKPWNTVLTTVLMQRFEIVLNESVKPETSQPTMTSASLIIGICYIIDNNNNGITFEWRYCGDCQKNKR